MLDSLIGQEDIVQMLMRSKDPKRTWESIKTVLDLIDSYIELKEAIEVC